jgi:hypothetical protein
LLGNNSWIYLSANTGSRDAGEKGIRFLGHSDFNAGEDAFKFSLKDSANINDFVLK